MLGKLLKHELNATGRLLLPMFLILAVFTVMDRIVLGLNIYKGVLAAISGFITFAYGLSILTVIIVTSVFVIYRFYKNLMTDEGYLMFTLPVKPSELINSKLLIAVLWTVVAIAAIFASLFGVFSGSRHFPEILNVFEMLFKQLADYLGSYITLFYIEFAVLLILSIISSILMIYVSVAIGQLLNGHKLLGSIGAYIVLSIIIQVVSTASLGIVSLTLGKSLNSLNTLPQLLFPMLIVSQVVMIILFYWGTNFLFKRKLNLD